MNRLAVLASVAVLSLPGFAAAQGSDASASAPAPASAPATGGLRYTIQVAKFENHAGWSGQYNLSDQFGSVLTDSLQQTGRFIVIAESDMRNAAMQEQDFAAGGRTAGGDKAPVKGQLTPAQLLVKGEITHYQDGTEGGGGGIGYAGIRIGGGAKVAEVNAVMYIVDTTTGQVKASKKVVGRIESKSLSVGLSRGAFSGDVGAFKKTNGGKAIEAAIDEGVAFLMSQLENIPWTANVISAGGNKIYINRGSREGVTAGQVFKVGSAEVLRDPGTGEVLDTNFTEKAEIRADTVKEKVSICTLVSGSGVEQGMAVEPK